MVSEAKHIWVVSSWVVIQVRCGLIVTLVTRILDTIVYGLDVYLETTLLCGLIVTLVTRILDTIVYRLYVFLKATL